MADISPVLADLYAGRRNEAEARAAEAGAVDVFEAAALGRTERVEELLRADPGLASAWTPDGFSALHLAAFFGGAGAARVLLEHGAEVDAVARNSMHVTPLHSAAAAREVEIARLLIEHGADVNACQEGGFTPLHAAAQNGDDALYRLLVDHGADEAAATDDGRSVADFR